MKVKVVKSFTDKNTMDNIEIGKEIEVTKERFGELTAGSSGIFVEKIIKQKASKK